MGSVASILQLRRSCPRHVIPLDGRYPCHPTPLLSIFDLLQLIEEVTRRYGIFIVTPGSTKRHIILMFRRENTVSSGRNHTTAKSLLQVEFIPTLEGQSFTIHPRNSLLAGPSRELSIQSHTAKRCNWLVNRGDIR